jgi:dienelactone hydrolase
MKKRLFTLAPLLLAALFPAFAESPRVPASNVLPNDSRLAPLKDLNGYFPFTPPASAAAWKVRSEYVRRQILVAEGLWPMPTKTPLKAVIHGRIDCGEYTVEKVYFESAPGFYVTGNLYRPKNVQGKVPGILFAHGHKENARLVIDADAKVRQEIADGAERFEKGGRSLYQAMCVQLARMGCVVWQWDMLGDSDSIQLARALVHTFKTQRPEMNTTERWGLYSPQAEAHLQSIMGLQTLNSIRGLDFLLSLPEVDPERVAVTGSSGGGTQTMILSAIDDRIKLSFPVVMVSTAMQGGCTCESASLLRVNSGNVEFAGLFAPKPLGMNTADDWTKEMAVKGFPDLQKLYSLYGAKDKVFLLRGEHFPHNYNAVTRSAFYTFLNKHFKLGQVSPVIERDFEPLAPERLTVWDGQHPAPKAADPEFERTLLAWLTGDAERQLRTSAASSEGLRKQIGAAVEVLIGRTLENAGDSEWTLKSSQDRGDFVEQRGLLHNTTYNEELPVVWLCPKKGNGRTVVWLDDSGKAALFNADGAVRPDVLQLVNRGASVLGADLLFQGEFLKDGQPVKQTRVVENPREFAGYTFCYNHTLFAQRTHDVLTLVAFLRGAKPSPCPKTTSLAVAGFGGAGPVAAAARALAGPAIDRTALDTCGFRFAKLLDYRDPRFLPGGAKYLDLPGLLALGAPHPLWLAGEEGVPALVSDTYRLANQTGQPTLFSGASSQKEAAAVEWLLQ